METYGIFTWIMWKNWSSGWFYNNINFSRYLFFFLCAIKFHLFLMLLWFLFLISFRLFNLKYLISFRLTLISSHVHEQIIEYLFSITSSMRYKIITTIFTVAQNPHKFSTHNDNFLQNIKDFLFRVAVYTY